MKFELPWAKRNHYHPDLSFLHLTLYTVCSGCGHLILIGQVRNKSVRVLDRSRGGTIEHTEVYGESCVPSWDTKEIGMDGEIRYYKDGARVETL